jgi:hypothetical protein
VDAPPNAPNEYDQRPNFSSRSYNSFRGRDYGAYDGSGRDYDGDYDRGEWVSRSRGRDRDDRRSRDRDDRHSRDRDDRRSRDRDDRPRRRRRQRSRSRSESPALETRYASAGANEKRE